MLVNFYWLCGSVRAALCWKGVMSENEGVAKRARFPRLSRREKALNYSFLVIIDTVSDRGSNHVAIEGREDARDCVRLLFWIVWWESGVTDRFRRRCLL